MIIATRVAVILSLATPPASVTMDFIVCCIYANLSAKETLGFLGRHLMCLVEAMSV